MKNQGWFVSRATAWAVVVSFFGQTVYAGQAAPDGAALSAFQKTMVTMSQFDTFETALDTLNVHFNRQDRGYIIDTLGKQIKDKLPKTNVRGDTWVIRAQGQEYLVKLKDPKNDVYEYNGITFHYDGKKSLKANRETLEKAWFTQSPAHSAYHFSVISEAHAVVGWIVLGGIALLLGMKIYYDHKEQATMRAALKSCYEMTKKIASGSNTVNETRLLAYADALEQGVGCMGPTCAMAVELSTCLRENVKIQRSRGYSSDVNSPAAPELPSGDAR